MGYIRNHAIVVSGWSAERVMRAHTCALATFERHGLGRLVSGIVQHITNGGAAFFVSPDGSKEGWEPSDQGNAARAELIAWLRSKDAADLYLDWCELVLGGDDGEYTVTASRNHEQFAPENL